MPPAPGWIWDHFLNPPFNPETETYGRCSNTKLRTYCLKCLEEDIAAAAKIDEELVLSGQLPQPRSRAEIQLARQSSDFLIYILNTLIHQESVIEL